MIDAAADQVCGVLRLRLRRHGRGARARTERHTAHRFDACFGHDAVFGTDPIFECKLRYRTQAQQQAWETNVHGDFPMTRAHCTPRTARHVAPGRTRTHHNLSALAVKSIAAKILAPEGNQTTVTQGASNLRAAPSARLRAFKKMLLKDARSSRVTKLAPRFCRRAQVCLLASRSVRWGRGKSSGWGLVSASKKTTIGMPLLTTPTSSQPTVRLK